MFRTLTTTSTRSSPSLLTTAPLTRSTLNIIRGNLEEAYDGEVHDPSEKHAAVLVPFCNVNNNPGILLQVRGKLRTHSGEVSFPGGRIDQTDVSPLAAALRETQEEVGIHPDQVEILGRFGPAEKSLSGLRVWPYVGFVHPRGQPHSRQSDTGQASSDRDMNSPLPSLPLSSLTLSSTEVAHAFHLPVSAMVSPPRLHNYQFRGSRPYFAVDVSDIVARQDADIVGGDGKVPWASDPEKRDEIGSGREGRLEVWGLTGWYLSSLLKILGLYQ